MTIRIRLILAAVAASGSMAAGCAEELGPTPMATTRVVGRLTIRGRPVRGGWLELMPIRGTIGNQRSAPIASDGSFQADRVPLGPVGIRYVGPPLWPTGEPSLDRYLLQLDRFALIRRDTRRSPESMAIDLKDEQRAFDRRDSR